MRRLRRRDWLKGGVGLPMAAVAASLGIEDEAQIPGNPPSPSGSGQGGSRERLLLDFDWRFHFGHASDPTKDFGFGSGRAGAFQKTGGFLAPSNLTYDDSDWKAVNLPHDWAIGLPLTN